MLPLEDSIGSSCVQASAQQEQLGIDEYFDPPVDSKYECPICFLVLREPVQTQCGHRFCRNCIVRSLREAYAKCPCDNVPLSESQVYPDNFAKREINMFTVWCRHHRQGGGCDWKGPFKELEKHMTECQFVMCINKCGAPVQKVTNDVKWHEHKVDCPMQLCGICKESFLRSEFESHHKECKEKENAFFVEKLKEFGPQVEAYRSAPPHLQQINSKLSAITNLENRFMDLDPIVCNGTYIYKVENYDEQRKEAISRGYTSISSKPFYIFSEAQKMCLRVHLNGVDSGSCDHISLFVHMMKGTWDDMLKWPFTGRITLAILDQSENVAFRRPISETLVAKPNLLAFQKPTSNRNHKGYGYVEFCQIKQLVPEKFIKNNSMLVRIQVFH